MRPPARPSGATPAWLRYAVIRRRAKAAGIAAEIGCHTFRATGITAYLANGGAESRAKGIAHAKAAISCSTASTSRRREPPPALLAMASPQNRMAALSNFL